MVEEIQGEAAQPVEETVANEQSPMAAMQAEIEAMKERYKNIDRTLSRKDDENKRLRETLERRDDEQATMKAMVTLIASRTGQSEDEVESDIQERKPNLAKQFETLVEGERKRREQDRMAQTISSYQSRTQELGLTEADKEYWAIYGAVAGGKYDRAEKILDEVAEVKKPKVETLKVESKKEDVEEAARKMLEERGLLKTETPRPSTVGQTWTMEQVRNMNAVDYAKHFPGGFPQVAQMVKEGKIKV